MSGHKYVFLFRTVLHSPNFVQKILFNLFKDDCYLPSVARPQPFFEYDTNNLLYDVYLLTVKIHSSSQPMLQYGLG